MNIQIITREVALQKANELKEKAFAIAESFGTLPGYCQEPECVAYVAFTALMQLREGEACIFINGEPAMQLTDFALDSGQRVIGKICAKNIKSAYIEDGRLHLSYTDGVIDTFKFREQLECWEFEKNNVGGVIKPHYGILN